MPTELREHQHELLLPDESLSLVFGTEDTGYLELEPPSFSTEHRSADVQRVREDGVGFGEDYLGGKTAAFELGALTDRDVLDPHRANLDALDLFEAVWYDDRFRGAPDQYGILRTLTAGRVSRCYGRPRKFEPSAGRATRKGYTPFVCDFALVDNQWYADTVDVVTLPTGAGGTSYTLRIGGTRPTWPVLTFTGGTSPFVDFGEFKIGLNETLTANTSITVDPRPWVRAVTRSDDATRAGKLMGTSPPLRKMRVRPGDHWVSYSGGGSVRIEWRDAYARP